MHRSEHGSCWSGPGGDVCSVPKPHLFRGRLASVLCGIIVVSLLTAGCAGAENASNTRARHQIIETKSTRSSARSRERSASTDNSAVRTTVPVCGSLRDPFDPTNTPPPPDSPAIC